MIIVHVNADHNRRQHLRYPRVVKELVLQKRIQPDGLPDRSRKAIKNKATRASASRADAGCTISQTRSSGHQVAALHIGFGLESQARCRADIIAQQVTGGDLRDPKCRQIRLACVPLPAPGGPSNTIGPMLRESSAIELAPCISTFSPYRQLAIPLDGRYGFPSSTIITRCGGRECGHCAGVNPS